jgi:HSP20 family protein
MAETKTNQRESTEQGGQSLARRGRENRALTRWDPAVSSPFEFMERMNEEMDRWFDRVTRDFGFPRRSSLFRSPWGSATREGIWAPRIEAFQKDDRFIVRAELPGLSKDDVTVEVTDQALTIRGERRDEREEEREGFYHSEREYGQFSRTIPLPEGVITENANATFRDGVLEISMPAAPPEANRGRRLEIKGESQSDQKK